LKLKLISLNKNHHELTCLLTNVGFNTDILFVFFTREFSIF
jgi:hypothetical protein